ncbi:MAG: methionine--tRNA ligase [Candidatus Pacearchaeota archaeon]|nr:methionine--tRNA ligase [Candidatus Pacearchaeota archaeon]
MEDKFYITTTIPYANAPPHIGFALEIIQADILARWNTLHKKKVFFLTGTDEHGTKNYQTAKKQKLTPQEFVDKNSELFKELTKALNISNNYFIRTTDKKRHWPGAIEMWRILKERGDIYKKKYSGKYCSGCERFITEKELEDNKCPEHPSLNIQQIEEENYFFRLSKYSDKIKKLIETNKLEILPEKWKNDFLGLIKNGLTDVSFSRDIKHLPWGIPVPEDKNQVLYVWCDALTNYLTGIGFPNKKYEKFWPADIHLVGKDMLRFHAGIWPGMLLSAGLQLPKKIIVHGFLTIDGKKMSKSTGNVISPLELAKKYSSDSIRYYLTRTTPFGDDGDFSEKALMERHNNELANKLGNLVSRVSTLAEKYGIEKCENELALKNLISDWKSKKIENSRLSTIKEHFKNYELDRALSEIFAFLDICNEYIQKTQPWKSKDKKILYELADSIKSASILLWPFIPETSEKIANVFGFKISISELNNPLKISKIKKSEILFNKIK